MNKTANRLINEKSPYLQQHAYNPVDWYPWSDEAFEKAQKENKPIFLSIGYSTCHWCHVMEHESFESEQVAELMNDTFVNIKVDREERPDIDKIYMLVCQMVTGRGGWPLTIVMTPDKKPFYAATYLPKQSGFNNLGMLDLVPGIKNAWENDRGKIQESIDQIKNALESESEEALAPINDMVSDSAFRKLLGMFDEEHGGFGTAPKFPSPHQLTFLMRYAFYANNNSALEMTYHTLKSMRKGGIYDHVGKGFHRYSTDQLWLLPHFEKMLYDQATLARAYTEAWLNSKNDLFKETALDILEYVSRDMTDEKGGFYSAEDADSEGVEGKFYVWEKYEIEEILGQDADYFCKKFNIREGGNYTEEAAGHGAGGNIPHLDELISDEEKEKVDSLLEKLFLVREKRIHPLKDKKILTDWNALMISSFAFAGRSFNNTELITKAEKAYSFIKEELFVEGVLYHRWMDGDRAHISTIDDFAFLIAAQLDLYEATFKVEYLSDAIDFCDIAIKEFWDNDAGAFYFSSSQAKDLIIRRKEIYDGAIPSGNSVFMMNLLRLFKVSGNEDFFNKADQIVKCFSSRINSSPSAFTALLSAYMLALNESFEVMISGEFNHNNTLEMINALNSNFLPNMVLLFNHAGLEKFAPFTKDQVSINNKTTAYVCKNFSCDKPTNDVNEMLKNLGI